MKIGIVGLGLIGGSLGLSLKNEKIISCVSGMDLNKEHEEQAIKLGLVHEILTLEQMKQKCDMIFLAIPVEAIIKIVKVARSKKSSKPCLKASDKISSPPIRWRARSTPVRLPPFLDFLKTRS